MSDTATINLLVALYREATPIIKHYSLKRDAGSHAWPVYHNDSISLIVSGMGKTSAAAAAAWLQAQRPAPCWINIGIAGHASKDIGSTWLAHKVTDMQSGESWYPQRALLQDIASMALMSTDTPAGYESECALYDMEAAGFISTVARFTTLEWIQLIKIVSDNRQHSWQQLDRNTVPKLVEQALPFIDKILQTLTENYPRLHPHDHDDNLLDALTTVFHFTVTQTGTLKVMLSRCKVLDCTPNLDTLMSCDRAAQVLQLLSDNITEAATEYKINNHG